MQKFKEFGIRTFFCAEAKSYFKAFCTSACLLLLQTFFLYADGETFIASTSWAKILNDGVESFSEYIGSTTEPSVLKRSLNFDSLKNPLKERIYGKDGQLTVETTFFYNGKGLLSEISGVGPEKVPKWRYLYKYTESGKIQEEASYNAAGNLEWRDVYRYNDLDLLVETKNYNSTGVLTLQKTFQYDEKQRLSINTSLYADGGLLKNVLFFYNEKDQLQREDRIDRTGLYEQVLYIYNDLDQLIEQRTSSASGGLKETIHREYDSRNCLIKESVVNPGNEKPSETSFIYDSHGNLTEQRSPDGSILLRKLVYRE